MWIFGDLGPGDGVRVGIAADRFAPARKELPREARMDGNPTSVRRASSAETHRTDEVRFDRPMRPVTWGRLNRCRVVFRLEPDAIAAAAGR